MRQAAAPAPTPGWPGLWPACALAVVLMLACSAGAHPEEAAPQMRPDVVAVGHVPEVPKPGQQWEGFVEFVAGHDIVAVQYQICEVGNACFAPPAAARRDNDTFLFDTSQYVTTGGEPVDWGVRDGGPWHIGYKFLLHHADGEVSEFPEGIPVGSAECDALGPFDCDATKYFVFTMPGAEAGHDASAPLPVLGLLAAAWACRRGADV